MNACGNLGKIDGFEKYRVSEFGEVFNVKTGRKMKQQVNKSGYLTVSLCENKKKHTYLVHRLVAFAFLENPMGYTEVNHRDENKTNNKVENLEWCTHGYNSHYGDNAPSKQMTAKIMQKAHESTCRSVIQYAANGLKIAEFKSVAEAARSTGVGLHNIHKCCSGKARNKTAGGYRWEYKGE